MDPINSLKKTLLRCQNDETKDCFRSCIRGYYINNHDKNVSIKEQINNCLMNTQSYPPETEFELPPLEKKDKGIIEIRNESTLRAAYRLVVEEKKEEVCALNFANGFHPGGGVIYNANAQEETLCRSSALYCSLIEKNDFYDYHIAEDTNLASNYLIFSPSCPTWKIDNYEKLDQPFLVSYITSAAVHNRDVQSREQIREIHDKRIKAILECAIENGVKNIILGAFGCGAFRNNPEDIAGSFKHWLIDENLKDYFETISFSIIERKDSRNIDAFSNVFNLPIIETEKYQPNKEQQEDKHIQDNKQQKEHKKNNEHKQQRISTQNPSQHHPVDSSSSYEYSDYSDYYSEYSDYSGYSDYDDYSDYSDNDNYGNYWDYYYHYYMNYYLY